MKPKKKPVAPAPPLRGRKTWREKLADAKDLPKVVRIEGRMSRRWGQGTCAIPAPLEARLVERAQRRSLSPRELEVLDYLRRGLSNKDIGVGLGVTEHTAKAHVKAILAKLEAADRAEAVANGFQRGLLQVGTP